MEFVKLTGPFAIFFIMYSLGLKLNFINFYELLKKVSPLSMEDQQASIKNEFIEWKSEQNQIDDVLVIGLKI